MPPLFWPPFHATTCRLGPVVCDFYTVIISRVAHAVRPHSSGLRRDLWPCVRYIWGCMWGKGGRARLPALIAGHPGRLVRAGVFGARTDQPVVVQLFQDMRDPAA